jgi:hypothetical protein
VRVRVREEGKEMLRELNEDEIVGLEKRGWTLARVFNATPPEGSPADWYVLTRASDRVDLALPTFDDDLLALLKEPLPPPTPEQLAAVPAQMAADNLAATFTTTDEIATVAEQLHLAAKAGIANFKADLAEWTTLTDAQKLSHVEGLMQSMVGVLQHLTGDYS